MLTTREQERQLLADQADPVSRSALKATFHMRRYMPLYVFGTIWAVMIALLPTLEHHGGSSVATGKGGGAAVAGVGGNEGTGAAAAGGTSAGPGAGTAAGAGGGGGSAGGTGPAAAGARGPAAGGSGGPVAAAQVGTGTTRGGVACHSGVRQLPFSQYADPCVAAYSGNNGGSNGTRGVTPDSVTIGVRIPSDAGGPNAQAIDKLNQEAGNPSNAEQRQILDTLVPYFNKMFELYGRQVKLVDFNGQGNGTSAARARCPSCRRSPGRAVPAG